MSIKGYFINIQLLKATSFGSLITTKRDVSNSFTGVGGPYVYRIS